VSSENRQSDFTDLKKYAFISCDAQAINHVLQSQVHKKKGTGQIHAKLEIQETRETSFQYLLA
jgi:hypothetical protein